LEGVDVIPYAFDAAFEYGSNANPKLAALFESRHALREDLRTPTPASVDYPAASSIGSLGLLVPEESFAEAIAPMDANVYKFVKLLFRKGDPTREGKPAFTATARRNHSFLGMTPLPDLP
jgi:hypothetical protein